MGQIFPYFHFFKAFFIKMGMIFEKLGFSLFFQNDQI